MRVTSKMKERVIAVSENTSRDKTSLVGVLCEPETLDKKKPAVLILNSGIMHRIGTCRLSVKLSRALAESGIASVRFDYSGVGDSDPRRGGMSFLESAPLETVEVMDYIQKHRGINKFILYGLCSGADAAYETALVDKRVIGICQIDGYCYRTLGWYINHYLPRSCKLDVWLRYFKRKLSDSSHKSIDDIDPEYIERASYIREFPPKLEITNGLQQLVDDKVAMYCLFTDGQSSLINDASQFKKSFRKVNFGKYLTVDYMPEAEHIITEPDCQKDVVKRIVNWVLLWAL